MNWLLRWLRRLALLLIGCVVVLVLPVGYVEVACRGEKASGGYLPVVTDPDWQRAESRTLTTYPEWHIVHAYDDYAQVIATGDPHDYGFLRSVAGFWTSLCPLKAQADALGGMTSEQKMTIYTIGVSFTVELLAKASYEESIGRVATWIRGGQRAELDDLSARQAADYARFLQQVPWYQWDFITDIKELENEGGDSFRDRERRFALSNEAIAKAWYATVIANAVSEMEPDALRMRSVVTGVSRQALSGLPGVNVVDERPEGLVIETDRYRAFTRVLESLAQTGADMVEIAGNDQILLTVTSAQPTAKDAIHSVKRQGYGDWRHLILLPVSGLTDAIRNMQSGELEHVHDY